MAGTKAGAAWRLRKEPTSWLPELHKVGNKIYLRAWRRLPDGKRERVYIHKLVAEAKLGRALFSHEIVHHANRNTLDNAPDNIVVMSRSSHAVEHNLGEIGRFHENNPRARQLVPSQVDEEEI